jgi:hypothetical protein
MKRILLFLIRLVAAALYITLGWLVLMAVWAVSIPGVMRSIWRPRKPVTKPDFGPIAQKAKPDVTPLPAQTDGPDPAMMTAADWSKVSYFGRREGRC